MQSWLYRASSNAATGARKTGALVQALLPFGNDKPPIQSIVLLPQGGQQPSVRSPTQEPSPRSGAVPIQTDARAATELPSVAYEGPPSEASAPEAFALTIKPASNVAADGQPIPDGQPLDGTLRTAGQSEITTRGIVATEKTAGLQELVPPSPPRDRVGAEVAVSPEQVDTETVVRRDLVLLSNTPSRPQAEGQPPAPVVDAPVPQLPTAVQPETEVPILKQPESQPAIVASNDLPTPPPENWRVQLASLGNSAIAQAEWQRLRQIHPALLSDQPLHIEQVELDRGTFYRIQVGSFDSITSAQDLCDGLKTRGQDCLVVR